MASKITVYQIKIERKGYSNNAPRYTEFMTLDALKTHFKLVLERGRRNGQLEGNTEIKEDDDIKSVKTFVDMLNKCNRNNGRAFQDTVYTLELSIKVPDTKVQNGKYIGPAIDTTTLKSLVKQKIQAAATTNVKD